MPELGLNLAPIDAPDMLIPARREDICAWNPRMVFDIALGVEDEYVIRDRYDLSSPEFQYILAQPQFRRELAAMTKEIREQGITFATKAKLIAEEKLEDMYQIISNPHTDPKVRVGAWQAVAKAAGLLDKSTDNNNSNQNMINIQINL